MNFKIPPGIECPWWEPKVINQTSKLCRYYLAPKTNGERGLCELPDKFSCTEWDRKNPGLIPLTQVVGRSGGANSNGGSGVGHHPNGTVPLRAASQTSLQMWGAPVEAERSADAAKAKREVRRLPDYALPNFAQQDILISISQEQIETMKQSGLEICLGSDNPLLSEIWLVPTKTMKDRVELTFEEVSILRMIADVLPGSRVITIKRSEADTSEEKDLK